MKCRPRKTLLQPNTRGGVGVLVQNTGSGLCVRGTGAMRGPGAPEAPGLPIVFHAATYDPITYEMQQESVGVGGETCTHTSTIYAPDYLGVYHAFGANAPVWEGFRESAGQYYADDGAGTLLNPLPMLVYQDPATNIQIYSNDAQNASYWHGVSGGNQPTKDQVGLDGLPNNACLFTGDGSAAAYIRPITTSTIPADTNPTTFVYWIKKDPLATNELYGKSNIAGLSYLRLYVSPATGVLGAGSTGVNKIIDVGGWWKCMQQNTNEGAGTAAGIQFYPQATGGFTVGNFEIHNNKTIEQVQDLGPIFTTTAAVSTDEIITTWAAANHSDAGESYEGDYKLSGEDQILLSMGGTAVLEVVDGGVGDEFFNGTFDVVPSSWTDNLDGSYTCDGSASQNLESTEARIIEGETYFVQYEVIGRTSGSVKATVRLESGAFHDADGIYKESIVAGSDARYAINIYGASTFIGTVRGISYKQAGKVLRLTDGTNECSVPVVSATPHIKATYNATDGMTLDVDGVTATCPYDGTLGAGDLSTKATQRDLIRRES